MNFLTGVVEHGGRSTRTPYPTDVGDDEWAFVVPYLTLMDPEALQREHERREVFNALRWIVRAGAPWRLLPTNFPPWAVAGTRLRVQQTWRRLVAGCFGATVPGALRALRGVLRLAEGPDANPAARVRCGRFDAHAAIQSRERREGRLRRVQAQAGQQAPSRRRYPGARGGTVASAP